MEGISSSTVPHVFRRRVRALLRHVVFSAAASGTQRANTGITGVSLAATKTSAPPPKTLPNGKFSDADVMRSLVEEQLRNLVVPYLRAFDSWQRDRNENQFVGSRHLDLVKAVCKGFGDEENAFLNCKTDLERLVPRPSVLRADGLYENWTLVLRNLDLVHKREVLQREDGSYLPESFTQEAPEEERRYSNEDGEAYTKGEFQEYYRGDWNWYWKRSKKAPKLPPGERGRLEREGFSLEEWLPLAMPLGVKKKLYDIRLTPALAALKPYWEELEQRAAKNKEGPE